MKPGTIELLGQRFVDPMSTKITSNKTSIRHVARRGGVINDKSLKTGRWSSKAKAKSALMKSRYVTSAKSRLVGKRKTSSQCNNNQNKHHSEQRWHAKLMGASQKRAMDGGHVPTTAAGGASPAAATAAGQRRPQQDDEEDYYDEDDGDNAGGGASAEAGGRGAATTPPGGTTTTTRRAPPQISEAERERRLAERERRTRRVKVYDEEINDYTYVEYYQDDSPLMRAAECLTSSGTTRGAARTPPGGSTTTTRPPPQNLQDSLFQEPLGPSQLPKTLLPSPNTFATSLSMLATPERESYLSMLLSNYKCASSIKKLAEPTRRQLSFGTISLTLQTAINPFHYHHPDSRNGHGGRHRSIGQDLSKYNLHRAALLASYHQRDNVIKAFMKVGNPSQRRYILGQFLSHKSIIEDTKCYLQDHLMTNEARAGLSLLRSMKSILKRILRCKSGRISNGQRSFVNMVCACIHNCEDNNQLSGSAIGHHLGVNKNFVSRAKFKSYKRVALITSGDKKGFEFVDTDQKRSKFNDEQLTKFEQWIEKDCQLVIENPLKNDMVWMRGRDRQVIYGADEKPLKIQKKLLMSSYRELRLYMIDNYSGMVINEDTVLYSESTLMKIMPNHIKKAGERYKQMCGCQTCIIYKLKLCCIIHSWW